MGGISYEYKGDLVLAGDIIVYSFKEYPVHSGVYIGDGMINQKGGVSGSVPSRKNIDNGWNWRGGSGEDYKYEVWRKP